MSRNVTYQLLLALCLLVSSCVKDEPVEVVSGPDFFLNGTKDGQSVSLYAGNAGVYMETSYFQDTAGLYGFAGHFVPSAESWEGTVGVVIYDNQHSSQGGPSNAVESIKSKPYSFFQKEAPIEREQYEVAFSSLPFGGTPVSYHWDFGDGETSSEANPVHLYLVDPSTQFYNVCLTVEMPGGCTSTLCNDVFLPNADCAIDFDWTNPQGNFYNYVAEALPEDGNYGYEWTFSSGAKAYAEKVDYNYTIPVDLDEVCLTITGPDGCQATVCKNVVVTPGNVDCTVNFDYTATTIELPPIHQPDTDRFGTVEMTYQTPDGEIYSTEGIEQPATSRFEILEVEDYRNNADGQKTVRLSIVADAVLTNGSKTITLNGIEGKIAVAYP